MIDLCIYTFHNGLTHIAAFSAKNQKNLFITIELLTISEPQKFV